MTRAAGVVVVLTFNAVGILRETLTQAMKVSPYVIVIDSGSTDGTPEVARAMGAEVMHRTFVNYGDQRNWAIDLVASRADWQLHLDADEVLDDEAIAAIKAVLVQATPLHEAWMLRRRDYFLGRALRFSGVNPWHLRLFRSGTVRCEERLYDQHFVSKGTTGRLRGSMHDKNAVTLTEWIARHNRWSGLEAEELASSDAKGENASVLQPKWDGDARERTRFLKRWYYRLPGGVRAIGYFAYRYFFRLGFLDGRPGFYFAFFQALWFRTLVDAKLYERKSR